MTYQFSEYPTFPRWGQTLGYDFGQINFEKGKNQREKAKEERGGKVRERMLYTCVEYLSYFFLTLAQ